MILHAKMLDGSPIDIVQTDLGRTEDGAWVSEFAFGDKVVQNFVHPGNGDIAKVRFASDKRFLYLEGVDVETCEELK